MVFTNLRTSFFNISVSSEKNLMSQNPKIHMTFYPLMSGFSLSYSKLFIIILVPASPNPSASKFPDFCNVLIRREVSYCSYSANRILLHKSFYLIRSV